MWVNGKRIQRQVLQNSDRIEFGVPDSYQLLFALDGLELARLMDQVTARDSGIVSPAGSSLAKLRAILEVGRTLQNSAFHR